MFRLKMHFVVTLPVHRPLCRCQLLAEAHILALVGFTDFSGRFGDYKSGTPGDYDAKAKGPQPDILPENGSTPHQASVPGAGWNIVFYQQYSQYN